MRIAECFQLGFTKSLVYCPSILEISEFVSVFGIVQL